MFSRTAKDKFMAGSLRAALAVCLLILGGLLLAIVSAGLPAINWKFLTTPARDFGASGGIVYQIIGSLLMVLMAGILVTPFALIVALHRTQFLKSERTARWVDLSIYSLNAVPSIAFGLFGLILFVNILGTGLSWFVGAIILAMMLLPTVTLSSMSAMKSLPPDLARNGLALGLRRYQVIGRVIIPQSLHGLVTGLLIGLSRAIGETAPIMFIATAFSGVTWPHAINEPVASLPTHILALAQQATNPQALEKAWGASLTLLMLVGLFTGLAFLARRRLAPLSAR